MSIESFKYSILNLLGSCGITSKKVHLDVDDIEEFDTAGYSARLNIASTNNVIEFSNAETKFYFRECKKVVSRKDFAEGLITDFTDMTAIPINQMVSIESLRKFLNMDALGDESSALYKYMQDHSLDRIGLAPISSAPLDYTKIDLFIHYAWGEILNFKINRHSGNYQLYNYNRARCQYELYKLFGVERLICPIRLVKIKCGNGKWKVGSIMGKAPGVSPNEISDEKLKEMSTISLVRDLTTMNIMDALCTEGDHRPDNYNVVIENDKILSICSFDNDSPLSFFATSSTKRTSMEVADIINSDGYIYRKNIDDVFCRCLVSIDEDKVKKITNNYLSRIQQFFLIKRYRILRAAISVSMKKCNIAEDAGVNTYHSRLYEWHSLADAGTKDIYKNQHKLPLLQIEI